MPALAVPAEDPARDRRVALDREDAPVRGPEPEVPRCPERDLERRALGRRRLLKAPDRFGGAGLDGDQGDEEEAAIAAVALLLTFRLMLALGLGLGLGAPRPLPAVKSIRVPSTVESTASSATPESVSCSISALAVS